MDAALFGPEFVDVEATLRAEHAAETGRWDGAGVYAVPEYGRVGTGGLSQVLVGLDDGSLLNITWEVGGTGIERAEALRLTRDIATALVQGR